jgi:hypothetical protein
MLNSLKIPLFFYFGVAMATNIINKYMFSISIASPEIYWNFYNLCVLAVYLDCLIKHADGERCTNSRRKPLMKNVTSRR